MPNPPPQYQRPDERTKQFLHLLSQHERRLQAFVLSLVPNWDAAEELVQQTRIRLWEQFDKYDPEKDFGAWSRTIAYYQVLNYRKRVGREKARFSEAFLDAVAQEVARQSSDLDRRRAALQGCLEKLDDAKRRVLMRYYEGSETMRQIAESLGRPFEALRKSIFRTRLALTRCVDNALEADP
jgi:RNA polymerase sigma-70 factor (ECF subfamily)